MGSGVRIRNLSSGGVIACRFSAAAKKGKTSARGRGSRRETRSTRSAIRPALFEGPPQFADEPGLGGLDAVARAEPATLLRSGGDHRDQAGDPVTVRRHLRVRLP